MFRPVSGRRLAEEVAEQIQAKILSGALTVGERLPPERELAREFNLSPLVLREALHALEARGLVTIRKGAAGGTFIAAPTYDVLSESLSTLLVFGRTTLDQLTEARLVLEPEIAALAAQRRVEGDLAALRASVERSCNARLPRLTRRTENLRFHRLLASISGNPFLIASIHAIVDNLEHNLAKVALDGGVVGDTACYHDSLIDAIAKRDERRARSLMREHIEQIQDKLEHPKRTEPSQRTARKPSRGREETHGNPHP